MPRNNIASGSSAPISEVLPSPLVQGRRVVPVWLWLGVLGLSFGTAYWLIPSRSEAAMRLMRDNNLARAAEVMKVGGSSESSTGQVPAAVVAPAVDGNPEPAGAGGGQKLSSEGALSLLALTLGGAVSGDSEFEQADLDNLLRAVRDPAKALSVAEQSAAGLKAAPKRLLYEALGRQFLAVSNPGAAARCYETAVAGLPLTRDLTEFYAKSLRWAQPPQYGRALAVLEEFLAAGATEKDRNELLDLQLGLISDSGRSSEALEMVMRRLERVASPTVEQMNVLADAAAGAEQYACLTQRFVDYIASQPGGARLVSLEGAMAAGASKGEEPSKELEGLAVRTANFLSWSGQAAEGWPLFAALAHRGNDKMLDDCKELYDDIQQKSSMSTLLSGLSPARLTPELEKLSADLALECGHVPEAIAAFRRLLDRNPDDEDAAVSLTALFMGTGDFGAAAQVCREALPRHTQSMDLRRQLAEACLSLGDFDEAMGHYKLLATKSGSPDDREAYASLAEGLDQPREQSLALLNQLAADAHPDPVVAQSLAFTLATVLGDSAGAVDCLKKSLEREPANLALRLALGRCQLDAGKPDDAVATLAQPALARQNEAVEALLDAVQNGANPKPVLAYFNKNKVAAQLPVSPLLAGVRTSLLEPVPVAAPAAPSEAAPVIIASHGVELSARAEDALDALRGLAEQAYEKGNYAAARTAMDKFIAQHPAPAPQDWRFLGNICKAQGDIPASREAFARCLRSFRAQELNRSVGQAGSPGVPLPAAIN